MLGIHIVAEPLRHLPEKRVKALLQRRGQRGDLPKRGGGVASRLKQLREGDHLSGPQRHAIQPQGLKSPTVPAGKEGHPTGSAHAIASVGVAKDHAFTAELVQVRGPQTSTLRLRGKQAYFSPPQVICHDPDDVGSQCIGRTSCGRSAWRRC